MAKQVFVALLVMTLISSQSFACDMDGKSGIVPENSIQIPVGDKSANNMTKEMFLDAIERVASVYRPIIAGKGGKLIMVNDWNDGTNNAFATQKGSDWNVFMYGGFSRHPLMTVDAFILTVCHEIGHHVGGAPKYISRPWPWASSEGQADYFANLKCMRRVLKNDDNSAIVAKMFIDTEVTKKCQQVYKSESEVALCQRISMAGKALSDVFYALFADQVRPNFSTLSSLAPTLGTNDSHPYPQCRLDTFFQSALCDVSFTVDVDQKDLLKGVCLKKDGYTLGMRPLCWYKPTAEEL